MKVILLGAANPESGPMMEAIHDAALCTRILPVPDYVGFLDDVRPASSFHKGELFCGLPIIGGLDLIPQLVAAGHVFVNTISGSTVGRYETSRKVIDAGGKFVDFIHPTVRPFKHGIGTYCQDEVGIQADVEVGDNCAIHARAFISHECRIGNSCFVGAGTLAGRVVMEDGSYLGINATVLPDVRIGRWSIIGAGAVVLKDVPPYSIVVGNPAKVIREAPVYNAVTGELLVSGALT